MTLEQNIYKSEREAVLDVLQQLEIEPTNGSPVEDFHKLIADELELASKRVNPLTPEDRRKIIALYHS